MTAEQVPALIPGEAQESRFPRLDDLHPSDPEPDPPRSEAAAPRSEADAPRSEAGAAPEPGLAAPGVAELRRIADALEEIARLLRRDH